MEKKIQFSNMTVEDLILELSEIHSCQILLRWDAICSDKNFGDVAKQFAEALGNDRGSTEQSRKMLSLAMAEDGYPGIPGIKPRVIQMIETLEPCVRHARTGLPLLNSSEVNDAPSEWLLSTDAIIKIRESLLTDRQKEIIDLKTAKGRYTLEEAANKISGLEFTEFADDSEESSDEWDESDYSCDTDSSAILAMLSDAAIRGKIRMYHPGSDKRFTYNNTTNTEVRVYYEEAYWSDINMWLHRNCKNVAARLPDPRNNQFKTLRHGLPKKAILASDWGMAAGRMKSILRNPPNWVLGARISRGRRGGGDAGSALWNPVLLAGCLLDEAPHKKWSVPIGMLDTIFKDVFKDYLDEWSDYKECL